MTPPVRRTQIKALKEKKKSGEMRENERAKAAFIRENSKIWSVTTNIRIIKGSQRDDFPHSRVYLLILQGGMKVSWQNKEF